MTPVKWAHPALLHERAAVTNTVPVIPLDALEAWLKRQPTGHVLEAHFKRDLLAQVQAWEEGA